MRKTLFLLFVPLIFAMCTDEQGSVIPEKPYDPDRPVVLTDFKPKTGGLATQVIINGSNFGTDESELKVYFNSKRAKVVRTIGDLAYALVPKLPGDTCTVSVVMGKDSLQYGSPFLYRTTVQVSTIVGTPHEERQTKDGTLLEARLDRPFYLAVDREKNIIIGEWPIRARLVSEEKNLVTTLMNVSGGGTGSGEMMSGCTDHKKEIIYFPMNGMPYYYEFDPEKQWLARRVNPVKNPGDEFDLNGKYSMTACELDSMLYTITTNGELVKIDPETHIAYLVKSGILKDRIQSKLQIYLCFHPVDRHMLYFVNPSSMNPNDGPIVGTDRIYRMDINTLEIEDYAGSGVKGHQDGRKEQAEFNNPCQICFDEDGNMYVGDTDNYCVRRISTDGYVSTIAGIPGTSGNLDGTPEEATFNRFWGMKIDPDGTLYIADYYNHCLRKLTIE
jgi:hypothetical protein